MTISQVFNMDCMTGMAELADNSYDIAICDIPYGIGVGKMPYLREISTTVKQRNGTRLSACRNKKPYAIKDWDTQTPDQKYFDELRRVSRVQIIFGIDYVTWSGVGSGRLVWNKGVAQGVSFKPTETAYCSAIDDIVEFNLLWSGMQQAKSLAEPMTQRGNKKLNERRIHPCHKPVLLYLKLIQDYGFRGCSVIDTHVGGGSSRIAADMMGCHYLGFEIDSEYFAAQEKRFMQYKSQLKLQL